MKRHPHKLLLQSWLLVITFCTLAVSGSVAQPEIKVLVENHCSAVKDQGYSGTCWSFASISFIESEINRMYDRNVDLSEWFIVRNIYPEKVRNYIRTEGHTFLTAGGQTQDVLWVIENVGLVPESQFPGPTSYGQFNSAKLDTAVMAFAEGLEWGRMGLVSTDWEAELEVLLNDHLGKSPREFSVEEQPYTPASYRESLGLEVNDYIQVTSFNHHDYYQPFALESKYNWSFDQYMNLPLDEFISALDTALMKGFTVAVNIDVTEENFEPSERGLIESNHRRVDQEKRQTLFENGQTRVDHIMHIVGLAEIKGKGKYYLTKNSWGEIGPMNGFIYLSEDYIRSKSVSHTMHVDALPKHTRQNIGR